MVVIIRKLSFSPSITSQMDFYLHHCDYTIKDWFKKWVIFDYGKGELFIFLFFFFWLNTRIALTGVHPHFMKLGRDIDFGDVQGIGILVNTLRFGKSHY